MEKNKKTKIITGKFLFHMYKLKEIDKLIFFFYTNILLMKYFVVYLPLQIPKDSVTAGFILLPRKQKACGSREIFLFNIYTRPQT